MRKVLSTRLRQAWHSPTLTAWSAFAITTLNFFLLLPLALRMLPPGDFALWMLLGALANLQTVLAFGLTPTFTRLVAYALAGRSIAEMGSGAKAQKNEEGASLNSDSLRRIAATTHIAFGCLAIIAVLGGVTLGTWLLRRPVGFAEHPTAAWAAWGLFLAGNFVVIAGTGLSAILMGLNQVAVIQRWQTIFGILNVLASAAVLANQGGLLLVTAVGQFFGCLTVARNMWLCQLVDGGRLGLSVKSGFDREVWAISWPASWRSGVGNLVYYGYVQISGLIYAQFGNVTSVASYLFTLRLVQAVSSFSQAPFYSRIPQLAFLHGSGDQAGVLAIARKGMRLSYWVYALGILGLMAAAEPALSLMGKGQYHIGSWLLLQLAVGVYFERVAGMNLQLVALTNRIYGHIGCLGASIISLAVCALLGVRLGANAFALGIVCGQVGFQFWYAIGKANAAYRTNMWRFNAGIGLLPLALIFLAILAQVAWQQ